MPSKKRKRMKSKDKEEGSGGGPYVCPVCHKKICHPGNFKSHFNAHYNGKASRARNKKVVDGDGGHKRVKRRGRQYICNYPGCPPKLFQNWNRCFSHMQTHNEYQCGTCGKRFDHKMRLLSHLKTHEASYKHHQCRICNHTFASKWHLNRHEMSPKVHKDRASLPPLKSSKSNSPKPFRERLRPRLSRTHQEQHQPRRRSVNIPSPKFPCPRQYCDKSYWRHHDVRRHLLKCVYPDHDPSDPNWLPSSLSDCPKTISQRLQSGRHQKHKSSTSSSSSTSLSPRGTRSRPIYATSAVYVVPAIDEPNEPPPSGREVLSRSEIELQHIHEASSSSAVPEVVDLESDGNDDDDGELSDIFLEELLTVPKTPQQLGHVVEVPAPIAPAALAEVKNIERIDTLEAVDEHIGVGYQDMFQGMESKDEEHASDLEAGENLPPNSSAPAPEIMDVANYADESNDESDTGDDEYEDSNEFNYNGDFEFSEDEDDQTMVIPGVGRRRTGSLIGVVGSVGSAITTILASASCTAGALLNPLNWWGGSSQAKKKRPGSTNLN